MGNVLIPKNKFNGVKTRGGKITSEGTPSNEINETRINKNEPPRFEHDVHENPHDVGPELQCMTPATTSSGLVPNTVSQQPCIPPNRDDLDHLLQPTFDEYFNPLSIAISPVPVTTRPRAVDLADSLVSPLFDQDAPSTNLTSQESLSNMRQIYTPFEHLGRWTKDHPIANMIDDPFRSYLQNEHYTLWEVIEFSDSYQAPPEEASKGSASESSAKKKGKTVAITTEDMQKRRNDVKARITLLLALSDEHQLRFSKYETAQELWGAILKTFGGNEATKKTKKN
nr:hypothetical protein [Tanacetum cinerariifolium]